jgi:hypothetical protein
MQLQRQGNKMDIKEKIIYETKRGLGEATTTRIGGEEIKFSDTEINTLKTFVISGLKEVKDHIEEWSEDKGAKMSSGEADKQAKSFMRNYLKGVYGK